MRGVSWRARSRAGHEAARRVLAAQLRYLQLLGAIQEAGIGAAIGAEVVDHPAASVDQATRIPHLVAVAESIGHAAARPAKGCIIPAEVDRVSPLPGKELGVWVAILACHRTFVEPVHHKESIGSARQAP